MLNKIGTNEDERERILGTNYSVLAMWTLDSKLALRDVAQKRPRSPSTANPQSRTKKRKQASPISSNSELEMESYCD